MLKITYKIFSTIEDGPCPPIIKKIEGHTSVTIAGDYIYVLVDGRHYPFNVEEIDYWEESNTY